jgi:hypothetical protein
MKLRMKENSLRFRVSPLEMNRLLRDGHIEETVRFGGEREAKLTYALEQSHDAGRMTVRYERLCITVTLPAAEAEAWAESQEVGLYGSIEVGMHALELAVEKDFACLDKSDAENADTYPNPRQGAVC